MECGSVYGLKEVLVEWIGLDWIGLDWGWVGIGMRDEGYGDDCAQRGGADWLGVMLIHVRGETRAFVLCGGEGGIPLTLLSCLVLSCLGILLVRERGQFSRW